jgi:hypothetical protein
VFLKPMEPAVQQIVNRVQARQPLQVEAVLPKGIKLPKPRVPVFADPGPKPSAYAEASADKPAPSPVTRTSAMGAR